MESSNILIVGAGNVGKAMAGDLAIKGHNVSLYNRTAEVLAPIIKRKGIEIHGAVNGFGPLNKISSDYSTLVPDADIIVVTTPATAHHEIARHIGDYLEDGQIVLLCPGRTFGCIDFHRGLLESKTSSNIILGETQTVLYTTRTVKEDNEIFALKKNVGYAAFPANKTAVLKQSIENIYPGQLYGMKNILESGINNIGSLLHPVPTLLNLGRIESLNHQFKYYYEGITPTIAQFIEKMDEERVAIADAYNVHAFSVREWLKDTYGVSGENLYEALQKNQAYAKIDAPTSVKHRYIFEDIPTGLVPISFLGALAGTKMVSTNAVIDLASCIFGCDFMHEGRTLENLGLGGYGIDEILEFVQTGQLEERNK